MKHLFRIAFVGLLAAAVPAARPQAPAVTRPNVLLITLDTTRADRMGFLGSTRGLTPALDAFAKTAAVFTRAYSQAPITTVSHATILSGTFPPAHGVVDFGVPLRPSVPYLPQLFHDNGYRTAAFVGSLILDPRAGTAPGFDRGFDVYDAGFRQRRPGEDRYQTVERRGADVVSRALRWLDGARLKPRAPSVGQPRDDGDDGARGFSRADGVRGSSGADGARGSSDADGARGFSRADGVRGSSGADGARGSSGADGVRGFSRADGVRAFSRVDGARGSSDADGARGFSRASPWFLWVHLFDPHDPYDPPADLKARFAAAPYDGEIAAVDRLVGRLVQAAGADAIVAVTADHGEALGDHGEQSHGMFLYEAELHVPLVLRAAALRGSRIGARVRLADVAPTLLEAAGIAVPKAMQGESLLRLKPDAGADRPAYAMTDYPRRAFGWTPLVAWRADRFLYIRAPRPELYDLVADPAETNNLAATRARVVEGMQKELDDFVRRSSSTGAPTTGTPDTRDRDLANRLAALGYVSGSSGPAVSGVDPKDRIDLANALHAAAMAVDDGAFQKAIPLLEKVIATEPNVKLAQLQLGVARAHQKQYARAVAPLKRATELDPEDMFAHYELAVALYETGDLKTAAAQFDLVASRMPRWADAHYSLASVWARVDRVPDAIRELHAAIELEPRHFRANLLLGRILTLQGDAEHALPFLRTAVAEQPSNAEANQFLNDALSKTKK